MRLLFVGDVVGRSGRAVLLDQLPALRARWRLDFVVVNGENAAGGFGITEAICEEFLDAGADAVTLGNHAFDQREALVYIERQPRLIRPANFPPGTPGRGANLIEAADGARVLVVNMMGRVFMDALDDPFARDRTGARRLPARARLRRHRSSIFTPRRPAKNRPSAISSTGAPRLVVGTHTHTPSADHRILPGGTGYIIDVGMTGDYDSVIGMDKEEPLRRFTRRIPSGRFEPAHRRGDAVRRRRRDRPRRARQENRAGAHRRRSVAGGARFLGAVGLLPLKRGSRAFPSPSGQRIGRAVFQF